jgi:hypothetical protein
VVLRSSVWSPQLSLFLRTQRTTWWLHCDGFVCAIINYTRPRFTWVVSRYLSRNFEAEHSRQRNGLLAEQLQVCVCFHWRRCFFVIWKALILFHRSPINYFSRHAASLHGNDWMRQVSWRVSWIASSINPCFCLTNDICHIFVQAERFVLLKPSLNQNLW